ncbi:RING finger protein 17 isoform X4 [Xyrichtys novacula]|uniref:RING finger protein 17 isoform X4 n=1 Tax=Xyrichtys novacula TaxID=13765 RepID=A0AAV1H1A9_XYRNO|nr:RING finger protein 17 isoform X4 [Xyrichtys novacula]
MDREDSPSAITCKFCGEAFTLTEDGVEGNPPRMLLCGHNYCASCLQSMQSDDTIRCPECNVESTLPEGGVSALKEDDRIIGLIYIAKINKMKRLRCEKSKNRGWNTQQSPDKNADIEDVEQQPADIETTNKAVDEALVQAAENLDVLKQIRETLKKGLAEQIKTDQAWLDMDIKQAAEKAFHAVQKWKDVQLGQLTKLEEQFSTSRAELGRVQERIQSLAIAIQMAKEVRRIPSLKQYCTLDKVLETLQTPVDKQSFDMECITMGSGLSCVFQSEGLNQSLALSLKMETRTPRPLSKFPPQGHQQGNSSRRSHLQHAEGWNNYSFPPRYNKSPSPHRRDKGSQRPTSPRASSPSPRFRHKADLSQSDIRTPDVKIEEILQEGEAQGPPPTGPELAKDKWRVQRRWRHQMLGNRRNAHFYIQYVSEKRDRELLSRRINYYCSSGSCHFTSSDTVETGAVILVKQEEGLWCRGQVVEVSQSGCAETVKACLVTQLSSTRVFLIDSGPTKNFAIQSEGSDPELSLKAVNNHLRKMCESLHVELSGFAPQAIRCSLKDLVPYDLTKGWSQKAQVEFCSIVGNAAVEMQPLGQDKDSLFVELRKASMHQSSNVPTCIREYLVFIEVARYYSPVSLGRKPLSYYPPVYPKVNTEVDAVVSHINSPSDFYIQLVDSMEFMLLQAKLQECYNATSAAEEDLKVYCPVIEQAYVALFEDKQWYRAQVIGHLGERKVEVRYVDFGNKKILPVCDLRKIKDEFFALPALAIPCYLPDVTPVDGETWSEACISRFISLAHQKLITIMALASVPNDKPLPVKLFQSSLDGPVANISQFLVKEQLACFKENSSSAAPRPKSKDEPDVWDPPLDLDSVTEGVDVQDQKPDSEQDKEQQEFQPGLKVPAQLKDIKVRVSHVNSPSSLYVQLTQNDSQLIRISELVKKECALVEPDEDAVWEADTYCAAHINGVWERGQICSDVRSSKTAEVLRCDHGNKVMVHISNLRPLPPSLIGSMALECTLTDIRPAGGLSTWTATACDLISYYLTGASAVMTIKELIDERPQPITLFRSNKRGQFVNMADFLTSEGLALRERKPRSRDAGDQKQTNADEQTPPAPRTIMSAKKVKTQLYPPPELPCLGHIQVNVSAIGDDGVIYVRTQDAECQLEQLREKIMQSIRGLPRHQLFTWKSVLGCAVIGSDMLWYRGQLLEVLGGHVKVQYVDYGLVESIPVIHVYPTLLYEDVPQLCLPCQLHSISPVGGQWQIDAVALLREMLLNRCVDVQVKELPSDPRAPLTVELYLDGMSLSRIMCHHAHASVDQTASEQKRPYMVTPPPLLDDWDIDTEGLRGPEEPALGPVICPKLPQKGERFKVRVKHLWTPNELFLWSLEETDDVKVDGETLDEALTRINENLDSLPRLSSFPYGGLCLAEYSDGNYYRAKLMKISSVEPVMLLVRHVDYGSDDTLPPSKLRQMPAELLSFPSRAIKVEVAGFKAPSIRTEEVMLPYSPEWSVRATMAMMDLLNGDITAYVVAREPELTVLLYNEDGELVHLSLVSRGLAELV